MLLYIILIIVICVICGVLSYLLYEEKGYSGGFLIGFFLGIIGLIYAAGRPNVNTSKIVKNEDGETVIINQNEQIQLEEEQYEICPNCGWQVFQNEDSCSNCGAKIN